MTYFDDIIPFMPVESPSKIATQWHTKEIVNVGWMRQFEYFLTLSKIIADVEGDFIECGLGEGNTFSMLAYLIGSMGNNAPKRKLWGFDSFEGWPEPMPHDNSPRNPEKGEWAIGGDLITKNLEKAGINKEYPDLDIQITKGFLKDTLPHFPRDKKIAFLHIDVDLYEGYKNALEFLFPLVTPGGIIAFDEYKEYPNEPEYDFGEIEKWPGCTKAIDDYFKNHPEEIKHYKPISKYYIVKSSKP